MHLTGTNINRAAHIKAQTERDVGIYFFKTLKAPFWLFSTNYITPRLPQTPALFTFVPSFLFIISIHAVFCVNIYPFFKILSTPCSSPSPAVSDPAVEIL